MRNLLLSLAIILFTSSFLSAQLVPRKVLAEEFTQASCGPCASQNPAFNTLLDAVEDKVVPLKYQTSWPGYDPMNEHNPEDVQTRVSYYGVTGVPSVRLKGDVTPMGGSYAGAPANVTGAMINNIYNDSTPVAISVDHTLSPTLDEIAITVTVTNVGADDLEVPQGKMRIALIEKELLFPFPPGSTTEADFYSVMRDMYPNAGGTALTALAAGESITYDLTEAVPDYIYDYNQVAVVAFWQDDASKEVYQAEQSQPQPLGPGYIDLGYSSNTTGPAGLCDYTLIPELDVVNDGSSDITSMDLGYSINGEAPIIEAWTGTLAPGESLTYTFADGMASAGGATEISYVIQNVNGGALDVNKLNELVEPDVYYTLSAGAAQEGEYVQDFESTEFNEVPDGMVIIEDGALDLAVVEGTNLTASPPNPVGGYAASDKSILVYFWGNLAGEQFEFILDKTSLVGYENTMLVYDRAYAQYTSENDKMEIFVSEDCGTTWNEVFEISGSNMATRPASTSFFIPSASQWVTDSLDLSAYDGAEELAVRFLFTSAYGNNMYLDNINLTSELVSSTRTPGEIESVSLYPNPTAEYAYIDFTLMESAPVSIEIFDLTGKRVDTVLGRTQLGAGSHQARWMPGDHAGVYMVKIRTDKGEMTQRLVVTH